MDFVLDFETLGTGDDCVVLSLAVTPFERDELKTFQEYIDDTIYYKFDVESQVETGRKIDQKTLEWWDKQDVDVKNAQVKPTNDDITLRQFLVEFYNMCKELNIGNKSVGWARGKEFDFGILCHIIKTQKYVLNKDEYPINEIYFPVPFWQRRDIRDYIAGLVVDPNITKIPLPAETLNGFEHHNPVHDCARAVLHIKYGELYARGEMDIPDDVDPNSNSHEVKTSKRFTEDAG